VSFLTEKKLVLEFYKSLEVSENRDIKIIDRGKSTPTFRKIF